MNHTLLQTKQPPRRSELLSRPPVFEEQDVYDIAPWPDVANQQQAAHGNAAVYRTETKGQRFDQDHRVEQANMGNAAFARSLQGNPAVSSTVQAPNNRQGTSVAARLSSLVKRTGRLVSRAMSEKQSAHRSGPRTQEIAREDESPAGDAPQTTDASGSANAAGVSPPAATAPMTAIFGPAAADTAGKSSEHCFEMFTRSTATRIASVLPGLGQQLGRQFQSDRVSTTNEAPSVRVSIPGPAEPVEDDGPAEPTAMPSAEMVALEPPTEAQELSRDETAVPSKPGSESISTDAGRSPQFRRDGEAHPNRMAPVADKARLTAAAGREAVIGDLSANRSAERIIPIPVDRAERIELPEATSAATSEATAEMLEYLHTDVPSDVRAVADADFAPLIESSLAGPRQQVQEAANKRDADQQQAFDEAQAEADAASAEAQAEQQRAIADGRAQIDEEKKKGFAESESKLAEFNTEVQTRHEAARTEIDTKIADEQARADAEITDGEARARTKRDDAEKEAKRREDEVQRDKPKEEKNFWGKLTSWFKRKLREWKDKLKSVVKEVIDAARTVVNGILDAAKKAAVGIIRALRTTVVGMIRTFAAGLKVLVSGLLVFFPKLRERVNAAIDMAVDTAVEIVDGVAKSLEDKVVALIDKVQSAVNRVFELFETVVMMAIDLAEALLTGNFMEAALILFRAACKTVGIPADEFLAILKDARDAFLDIIKRPAAFLGNLLKSVNQGFSNFMANFRQHFIGGITGWLFGKLAEGGITLPKTFTLKSIFGLLLQVLGFTYGYIRSKVVSLVGEDKVAVVEQVMGHIKTLLTEGPGAIWDWVKDQVGVIKQKIVDAVSEWLITQLIMKAVTKLATMFTPVGAFVQAVLMMYNTIMFFIERMKQIFELVKSITSSFTRIAKGLVSAAADWIERSMANGIPLIIAFLARLVGLGGIGAKVKSVVTKLRQPLDKAIEFVVGKLVSVASKAWGGIKDGAKKVVAWWHAREEFKDAEGKVHHMYFESGERGENARLMIASDPQDFDTFLTDVRKTGDPQDAKEVEACYVPLNREIATIREDKSDNRGPQKVSTLFSRLAARVRNIFVAEEDKEDVTREKTIGGQLLAGALLGDFDDNPTFWNMVGQAVVGLTPIGDARDIIANLKKICLDGRHGEVGVWLALGLSVVGFVPIIGDGIKLAGKAGLKWMRESRLARTLFDHGMAILRNGVLAVKDTARWFLEPALPWLERYLEKTGAKRYVVPTDTTGPTSRIATRTRTIDCAIWANRFRDRNGGDILHLKPKKTPSSPPGVGILPGDSKKVENYAYHSIVLKDGKVFDELNPKGINFEQWKREYFDLNKKNFSEAEFPQFFDLDRTPPSGVIRE